MARFRAFDSDASSSSSEDEQEVQQLNDKRQPNKPQAAPAYEPEDDQEEEEEEEAESSESEGSSGFLEEELIPRRSRSRKALFQDENGDFQVAGDDEDSDEESSSPLSSRSSPPVDPRAVGPGQNIIPWARHVGVDAQKMHVMQSSLFRMPEEAAALKALNQPPAKRRTVAALNLGLPTLNRKHSRDSEGDGLSTGSTEVFCFLYLCCLVSHCVLACIFRP
jgi:nuclear pore complex protein Nup98-Nup96